MENAGTTGVIPNASNTKKPDRMSGFFTYLVQIIHILLILEKLINRASMYYSSIIEFFIVYIHIDSFNL